MKLLRSIVVALMCLGAAHADGLKCTLTSAENIPTSWLDMVDTCVKAMEHQVKTEIKAAMTYLAMGAHFSRDTINRPGFSKFFFDSASEEREHALKVIEYLLMRGQLTSGISKLIQYPIRPTKEEWNSGVEALKDALELEAEVTNSIKSIIRTCESPANANDYHLVDYLTADFLDEQYKGQRDLAGKVSTLGKMMSTHGALGEFLFDKKLLDNQI